MPDLVVESGDAGPGQVRSGGLDRRLARVGRNLGAETVEGGLLELDRASSPTAVSSAAASATLGLAAPALLVRAADETEGKGAADREYSRGRNDQQRVDSALLRLFQDRGLATGRRRSRGGRGHGLLGRGCGRRRHVGGRRGSLRRRNCRRRRRGFAPGGVGGATASVAPAHRCARGRRRLARRRHDDLVHPAPPRRWRPYARARPRGAGQPRVAARPSRRRTGSGPRGPSPAPASRPRRARAGPRRAARPATAARRWRARRAWRRRSRARRAPGR